MQHLDAVNVGKSHSAPPPDDARDVVERTSSVSRFAAAGSAAVEPDAHRRVGPRVKLHRARARQQNVICSCQRGLKLTPIDDRILTPLLPGSTPERVGPRTWLASVYRGGGDDQGGRVGRDRSVALRRGVINAIARRLGVARNTVRSTVCLRGSAPL